MKSLPFAVSALLSSVLAGCRTTRFATARLAITGAVLLRAYVDVDRQYALAGVTQRTFKYRQEILNITRRRLGARLDERDSHWSPLSEVAWSAATRNPGKRAAASLPHFA
jgi:hypothetical protein